MSTKRKEHIPISKKNSTALEGRDAQLTPEAHSELTGRPPEDFEASDGLPLPFLHKLETHDAGEFYFED